MIGYLSKGGVTFGDTEKMTPYERNIAAETLQEVINAQNEAQRSAIEQAKSQQSSKSNPKSGINR